MLKVNGTRHTLDEFGQDLQDSLTLLLSLEKISGQICQASSGNHYLMMDSGQT